MISKRISLAVLITAVASPAFASDTDTARQINEANELVRAGKYDDAIRVYQNASSTSPKSNDELLYNLGVAQYREQDIAAAKSSFQKSAGSLDASLAAAARYNLGNCFYADAVADAENDKSSAIESLQQAIEHYRGSLSNDPDRTDARANIELANELLKKLQEEQQQDQQQQDQQQDSQQDQQQDQQNSPSQDQSEDAQSQDNASQSDSSQSDNSESKENESESKDAPQPHDEQQQSENSPQEKQSEQASDSDQSQQPDKAQQSTANQQEQPANSPADAGDAGDDKQQPLTPGEEQAIPDGELKPASESEAGDKPAARVGIEDPNAEEAPMTKEEALKMLQAVRDRDMLRRMRAEQIERNLHVTTDRDW